MELISCVESHSDPSFKYWNNRSNEAKKVFSSRTPGEIINDPRYKCIYEDVLDLLDSADIDFRDKSFLSLASGSCWLEALITKKYCPESITAIDFSFHRIHELAPLSFQQTCPEYKNVRLIHGDILNFDKPSKPFDIVILSQAFHHTNQPIRLLNTIWENLSQAGMVIIVGEHYYPARSHAKQIIKHAYKWLFMSNYRQCHSLLPSYSTLYPPCFKKGDIHYSKSDYHFIFSSLGWKYSHSINKRSRTQSFLLKKA